MPYEWVLGALCVWRLASLLKREKGPFDIFIRYRELLGIRHDDEGEPISWPNTFLAQVTTCVWCNSMWIAGAWVLAYYFFGAITIWVSLVFALSTGAIWLDKAIHG